MDPALGVGLERQLPALADEIVAEIGRAIGEYRRPLEGSFGRGLRTGVRRALKQFVALIGRPTGVSAASREVYMELGRGELRAGRGLDALQAAYRLGARVAWRRLSAAARERGADADTVSLLAESIFAYIEEISASSVEGYAHAQAELAGERERRRRYLVRMLLDDSAPLEEHALRAAALEAGWELPSSLAALACEIEDAGRLAGLIGGEAIGARGGELTCVLVPDPDAVGRFEQLAGAVERAAAAAEASNQAEPSSEAEASTQGAGIVSNHAALGPSVAPSEAALSFAQAREALRLRARAVLPQERLTRTSEHLLELLLHRDEALAVELARTRLAPLAGLPVRSRERLQETLLCWLRMQGSTPAVAAELHVHRQTVRYRLGRLRELLGSDLDDPERRLELELALRMAMRLHPHARA